MSEVVRTASDIPAGPYCYALADPSSDEVFYVGKGRRSRIFAHEKEARRGLPGAKCDRIRALWAAGLQVEHQILSTHETDDEAFAGEKVWIAAFAELTNITSGGGGQPLSAKERMQRGAEMLLTRIRPLNEWIATMPNEVYQAVCAVYGSPQACYEELIADIKNCMLDPTPNVITICADGTTKFAWE